MNPKTASSPLGPNRRGFWGGGGVRRKPVGAPVVTDASGAIAATSSLGVFATLREGLRISPEILVGIWVTLALAVIATVGRIVIPVAVQQTVDTAILTPGGVDTQRMMLLVLLATGVLVIAGISSAHVNVRLFRQTELGLRNLRVKAFRHVHDLSVLSQDTERRGSLVSRVTSDVDTISLFVQRGGITLLVSTLQIVVATVLMLFYSWQLTVVVWLCFLPLIFALGRAQKYVNRAYTHVRASVGAMLGAISEAIVGAETIRAYGVSDRTGRRVDESISTTRAAMIRAQILVSSVFSSGVFVANFALAAVVVAGTFLGISGQISVGRLLAFLFLVQLFTGPVQRATEILNELQNAVAGWRRVLAVLETPKLVVDLGTDGQRSVRGPARVTFQDVDFSYPGGPRVLRGVNLELPAQQKTAVVGATGSGKTTLAKLVTRLMDPENGAVLLDGVDLRDLTVTSLRERVVMVPQEGFLFDGTLFDNISYGHRVGTCGPNGVASSTAATIGEVEAVMMELGLTDWVSGFSDGLLTSVGQRGESLSAGERQLVAIARAYLARADLLVLDEATSAVDPATEVRIAGALDSLTAGRSTLTIAHRLSTAESSDLVVVVDDGRVVEQGHHRDLVAADGVYARMHRAWVQHTNA